MKYFTLICLTFCVSGVVLTTAFRGPRGEDKIMKLVKRDGKSDDKSDSKSSKKSRGKSGKKCFKNALQCHEYSSLVDGDSDPSRANTITCAGTRESSCYTYILSESIFDKGCTSLKNCEAWQTLNDPSCTSADQAKPGCIFCCGDSLCNDATPEIHIDPCQAVECEENFECKVEGTEAKCVCKDGLKGENCDRLFSCDPSPCQNGASCLEDSSGDSFCHCYDMLSGVYCETDNQEYNCDNQNPCPPRGSQKKFKMSGSATGYVECNGDDCSNKECESPTVFSVKKQSCVAGQ